MHEPEEIPELPLFNEGELDYKEFNRVVNEIQHAQRMLCFYELEEGSLHFKFTELDKPMYACLVVFLSQQKHKPIKDFLKLVLEGVNQVEKLTKKGFGMASKIESLVPKLAK